MKFLTKIANYFKNKTDLIDLIEEQSIKIQELEEEFINTIKTNSYLNERLKNAHTKIVLEQKYKIIKLEKEKTFIKQELKSLLENN